MAYVYDPINNTLIDDEDKSLGNKFAVLDPDLEKAIQELNERFGPGTVQQGTQGIPQPPIKIPQAIFEFEERMKGRMAEGGRINLQEGTDILIPKYPDLRMFPPNLNEDQAKAKAKILDKFKKDLKKYLLKEIKDFKKIALPKEKYQLIENDIYRAMGYDINQGRKPPKSLAKYVKETIKTLPKDGRWELNTTGKGQLQTQAQADKGTPIPEDIKNNIRPFFRKNYKTKTIGQMATELSKVQSGNKLNAAVKENLLRYRNFLIDKNVIKLKDIPKGVGGLRDSSPKSFAGYRAKVTDLAKLLGVTKDSRYFVTRGPNKGKFSYANFDNELLKFLNYNLIKGSLSPDFPIEMLPSFEHTVGIGPGKIIGEGDVLRKVELQTKQYNFDPYKGVSAKSKIFRDVQAYLKTAQKNFNAGNLDEANESLKTVNSLYDLVSERFSLKRKDLPKYVVDKKGIKEINVKQVLKPETVQKSFFNFFKKVANQASDKTLKQIQKVQPSVAKVINLFKKGKDTLAKDYIKIRMPDVKGGQLFGFAGYGPMPTIELGDKVMQVAKAAKPAAKALGTATLAVDPVFAALDFSKAAGQGVSGGEAASYTAQSFFQDLINLPRTLEDLAYTATEKGTFKNFGEKENRIFDYKPKTFADDYLKNIVEQTPKEVLEARKAIIDFDTTVRANMSMVDDIDIPESKAEIQAAKKNFMDEKGVDLSVLDNLEEDKVKLPGTPSLLESLIAPVTPDKTFNQFLANGGRAGFSNGGAAGADDNFLKELEFYFTNEDAELPKMQTYKETMNPVEILNDIIDPRNYPYYADVLARSGLRIGEFGVRVLPAVGKLVADTIQKGPFKITGSGKNNYVQDYTDTLPSNIKGTGIFSEFLENITPTSLEKKVGIDKLIKAEEQKQIERGSTIGPKVFADTIGLGAEVTAPIFPGLKLLNSFAKARNLPNDKATQKILEKEVDKVLSERGMTRREFLQATGASATVVMAKMLGLMDVVPKAAKVARAAPIMDNTVEGMPAWFKDAVYVIERKGLLKSRGDIKGIEPDFFEITLDTKLGKKKVLMSKIDRSGEITLDWTTSYYDAEIPVTITYKPGQSGKQNFLSDPEFPQSVEKYDVEVEAPEFEYKTVDVESMGPEDTSFDSAINLDIKKEADAVVEALEDLGLGLTKKQKKDAADNFRYYNEVELDESSVGPDTANPIDESDAYTFLDMIKRNKDK